MSRGKKLKRKVTSLALTTAMAVSMLGVLPESTVEAAASDDDSISNGSLTAAIGDLGEISSLTIDNNRKNSSGKDVNFVLPNDTNQQNNEAHQWMGEMIFSYRSSKDGNFPEDNSGFQEVDTNKTLAAGGSTTYSNASANLKNNPYIEKKVSKDKVEVTFKGQDEDSTDSRTMKGFNAKSVYDMDTDDGSLLWSITLENTSGNYLEFGDVGLPMPWNNKYASIDDTYNNRTTVHTFAGADSGYAYAIRCSGEGNYVMFTPVTDTGARIEYIDNWTGNINGVKGTRSGSTYQNWTSDTGGWFPGLQVYYIRGYYTDATSLVLKPGEKKTYQFKFSAVRAGDNTPQNSAEDANNASDSVEERENNMRSILYKEGMIDAVATPGFQTAINMPTKLDLHYDDSKISDVSVDIQCVHENDPWDEEHIPDQQSGMVNNSKSIEHSDSDSAKLVNTKTVDGEKHHIYELNFGCIGNNSVRVNYKLNGEDKFTQYEFNVLDKSAVFACHEQVLADFGPCDILLNGAGGNHPSATTDKEYYEPGDLDADTKSFFDLDETGVASVFNLNFMGILIPTQAFARDMVTREGCNILNISSMNAYTPLTKIPAYSGAKSAVSNFTQWLAVHFSKVGIRVNAIAPGFFSGKQNAALLWNPDGTPTARTKKILAATPMGRFGQAEELLGALLFLLNNEAASFVTGVVIPVDGGFSAYSGV